MADTADDHGDQPLSERFLDLFLFLPTGVAVTLAEELPRLAERGRERLGVQVNSARAVGHFAVKAGGKELKRRSANLTRSSSPQGQPVPTTSSTPPRTRAVAPSGGALRLRAIPRPVSTDAPAPVAPTVRRAAAPVPPHGAPVAATTLPADAHVPAVASLAIPGFDTLSASQVVQRLDGLSRSELVAVRAYETSTRGRRTILSRVDQLLDERS